MTSDLAAKVSGTIEDGIHRLPVRVWYEDTDFSGVVYHASYLRFMERGRSDFIRLLGVDQAGLHAAGGLAFAVRAMNLDFLKAARVEDILVVETATALVSGASLTLDQRVLRGDDVLVTASVKIACIAHGRAQRIPEGLRTVLKARA